MLYVVENSIEGRRCLSQWKSRRLHQNMEGQLAFFYVVPLYFRKIETFSQLLLNTCGLYFSKISCWLRKCLVPHGFMAFKPRYLQFKVYSEQGRREGNYRSDFRWEDGSWSRYEVKIQRSTGTTRPIGAPCFCLTLWKNPPIFPTLQREGENHICRFRLLPGGLLPVRDICWSDICRLGYLPVLENLSITPFMVNCPIHVLFQ